MNVGRFYVVVSRIPYPMVDVVWTPLNRDVWTLTLMLGPVGIAVGRRP